MALKTVVNDPFFDEIIPLLREFQQSRGELALAMLSSRLGQSPTWDLTLAGPALDRKPIMKAGADAAEFFRQRLGGRAQSELRFVRLRPMVDPLVQAFVHSLYIPEIDKPYAVSTEGMEEYHLDEAVVLLARPEQHGHLLEKLSA